jgi:hypothetical protein
MEKTTGSLRDAKPQPPPVEEFAHSAEICRKRGLNISKLLAWHSQGDIVGINILLRCSVRQIRCINVKQYGGKDGALRKTIGEQAAPGSRRAHFDLKATVAYQIPQQFHHLLAWNDTK